MYARVVYDRTKKKTQGNPGVIIVIIDDQSVSKFTFFLLCGLEENPLTKDRSHVGQNLGVFGPGGEYYDCLRPARDSEGGRVSA